jgi:hypothetical protein
MDGSSQVDSLSSYEICTTLGERAGQTLVGHILLACPQGALYVADIKTGDKVVRMLVYLSPTQVRDLGHRIRPYGTITIGR